MVNINIELPNDLHKKIKIYCAMNDLTLKDFIISTLTKSLSNNSNNKIRRLTNKNG
jgi:hypothetical protein